jgi:RNA polymerase sigma-70 factor (ECF subfamily)
VQEHRRSAQFEQALLPHLDAAYNLARWLTRRDDDAQDIVQEAYLRAFKGFGQFHGGNARSWLLTIVRNTCYSWLARNRRHVETVSLDEQAHDAASYALNPSLILERNIDREMLRQAIEALPIDFREVLILRELEGLSYQQISGVIEAPVGTVMSRLARARRRLQQALCAPVRKEIPSELQRNAIPD